MLPADYWRYFLIANAPESDDSSFTWEQFAATVNKDLADTLGNFVNRVLSFSRKRFGDEVPAGADAGEAEAKLGEEIARLLAEYEEHMEALQFRKAAPPCAPCGPRATSTWRRRHPGWRSRPTPTAPR